MSRAPALRHGDVEEEAAVLALTVKGDSVDVSGAPHVRLGQALPSERGDRPEGVWAEWRWDGGSLTVRNDRYGFLPVFFHASETRIVLSNSLVSMLPLGIPADLDHAALAVFLRLGFFVGNRTPFHSVRALPPGSELRWRPGTLQVDSNPPRSVAPYHSLSRTAAMDAFGEVFQEVVEDWLRHAGERTVVPLSGGRDSRHILLALLEAGRVPNACVTMRHFPPKPDEDASIASRLASSLRVPHAVIDRADDRFEAERRKNVLTNFCADEHAWMLGLADHVRLEGYSDLWDGIGGDVLSAGLFLEERSLRLYEAGRLPELADRVLPPEGYLPAMLSPGCYARWSRDSALDQVTAELERHANAPNPVGQFYFWNRTRREIAAGSWCLLAPLTRIYAPFLGALVYDLLSGLPAVYFLDHTFHSEAIARRYPKAASIPYEWKDAPATVAGRREVARFVLRTARQTAGVKRGGSCLRKGFLVPRLAYGLLDRGYGTRLFDSLRFAIYISQLEQLLAEGEGSYRGLE